MRAQLSKAMEDEVPAHTKGDGQGQCVVWVATEPQHWGSDKPDTLAVSQSLVFAPTST